MKTNPNMNKIPPPVVCAVVHNVPIFYVPFSLVHNTVL